MEHYVEQELAETTINTYKKRIRLYIKPYIGSYKLKNVQGEILRNFLAELHRTGMSRNMQHTSRSIHGKAKNCTLISEEWDFHSLRHTHATILYEAGVPMPLIQKRLGHINIQTTKRYTNHVTKKMLSMLDEVINGDNIDNNLE